MGLQPSPACVCTPARFVTHAEACVTHVGTIHELASHLVKAPVPVPAECSRVMAVLRLQIDGKTMAPRSCYEKLTKFSWSCGTIALDSEGLIISLLRISRKSVNIQCKLSMGSSYTGMSSSPHIVWTNSSMSTTTRPPGFRKLRTRGSNSSGHVCINVSMGGNRPCGLNCTRGRRS
jgi:hypothetical protein